MKRLAELEFDVRTREVTTVKELVEGDYFITLPTFRRGGRMIHMLRRRTHDPFNSLTFFGSRVSSFPSEKVYPVYINFED